MPPVLAALGALGAGAAGAGAGVGAAVGALSFTGLVTASGSLTLLGKIVITGALILATRLFQPEQPKPSATKLELKQAIPPRMFHYGRVRVAGPLAWYETGRASNASQKLGLYKIVLLSGRKIDGIETHFFNDEEVELEGDWADGYSHDGLPRAMVRVYLGADDQAADSIMMDAFGDKWTEAHQLRGIAYALLQFVAVGPTSFSKVFPNGEPQYTAILRGNLLYDPRKDSTVSGGDGAHRHDDPDTWEWSDNSALCILDFLTYEDGYAQPIEEMDIASFMAMADLCDEPVGTNLPEPDDPEPRYRTATTVYLNEARKDVLRRLLDACDGQLYQLANGTIGIRGGQWDDATASVSAATGELLDAEFTEGGDPLQRYNELAFQFTSPAHKFIEVEGDPWQDADAIAETGVIVTQTVDFSQVPSHTQARRLCKIKIGRDNPRFIGRARTNFKGLDMIGESVVSLSWDELDEPDGNFNGPFWITQLSLPADGTGLAVSLQTADPAAYEWDANTEAGTPPTVPNDEQLPLNLERPVVTGTAALGGVLTVTTGNWDRDYAYSYQWTRSSANIPGATASTYTLVADDEGFAIEAEVTATSTAGATTVTGTPAISFGHDSIGAGDGDQMGAGGGNLLGAGG